MNMITCQVRDKTVAELSNSIIRWINDLPNSDQEVFDKIDMDREMELLIDLLREGSDLKRLRDLYRKLSDEIDKEDPPFN
jgi:hypothetical protein